MSSYDEAGKPEFGQSCEKCGKALYQGEALNIKGKYICEQCAYDSVFVHEAHSAHAPRTPHERHSHQAPHDYAPHARATHEHYPHHMPYSYEPPKKRRVPSPFFHFIFSLHPGAGHMYLGLMKKGLLQMCLFYFCIFLAASMPLPFGMVIPIICLYSFFDSISLRRRIAAGEDVLDDISGAKCFYNANKRLVATVVLIIAGILALTTVFGIMGFTGNRRSESISVTINGDFGDYVDEYINEYFDDIPMHGHVRKQIEQQLLDRYREEQVARAISERNVRRGFATLTSFALIGIGTLVIVKVAGRKKRSKVHETDVIDRDGLN